MEIKKTSQSEAVLGSVLDMIASWQEAEEFYETFQWQVQGGHLNFWDILQPFSQANI